LSILLASACNTGFFIPQNEKAGVFYQEETGFQKVGIKKYFKKDF
jgi:hypothetical protein